MSKIEPSSRAQALQADGNSASALEGSQDGISLECPDFDSRIDVDHILDPESVKDENNRSYHGYLKEKYFFPNDPEEQDRLNFLHTIFLKYYKLLGKRLAIAPVEDARHVLDVGTGTGKWALEFAQLNRDSQVIGIDLSLIQPKPDIDNCRFIRKDAEEEWDDLGCSFDYVHLRYLATSFSDTKKVMRNAFAHMKPEAFIELQVIEINIMNLEFTGSPLRNWYDLFRKGLEKLGRDIKETMQYQAWLTEIGFVKVVERKTPLPCTQNFAADPELVQIGISGRISVQDMISGLGWIPLRAAGQNDQQISDLNAAATHYLAQCEESLCLYIYNVHAQKPEEVQQDP